MNNSIKRLLIACCFLILILSGCQSGETDTETVNDDTSEQTQPTSTDADTSDASTDETPSLDEGEIIKEDAPVIDGLKYTKSVDVKYAQVFDIDYFDGGYTLLSVGEKEQYLIVPEVENVPDTLPESVIVITAPVTNAYLATSPALALSNALGALDKVAFCGSESSDWEIESIANAIDSGKLTFAGKYNEPDYESLIEKGTTLAVESTMIESSPDVAEKLNDLGIKVLKDRSSDENHPLGKVEWLKFYAALMGVDMKVANDLFEAQCELVDQLSEVENTGKTVSIFFITSKGKLYVRNTNDYVTEMVRLAGGKYIFDELENSGSSSTPIEMETFYNQAKDADVMIYISSLGGKPTSLNALLERNALLADFKAVKTGQVWATGPSFFQKGDSIGNMIADINTILTDEATTSDTLQFLFKLQ